MSVRLHCVLSHQRNIQILDVRHTPIQTFVRPFSAILPYPYSLAKGLFTWRWGTPAGVEFMLHLQACQSTPNSSKVTIKSHSTEMLQQEQIMTGKEHWPPKCVVRPFTCLATTQQRLVTSPRDPGVASLHVNVGHFLTMARLVTSPTWGLPPPCKQALRKAWY